MLLVYLVIILLLVVCCSLYKNLVMLFQLSLRHTIMCLTIPALIIYSVFLLKQHGVPALRNSIYLERLF